MGPDELKRRRSYQDENAYYKDLYHFALCITKSTHLAEDVVSTAVMKAFENLKKLKKDASFKSWIFQITANEAKSVMKKKPIYLDDEKYDEPSLDETGYANSELAEILDLLNDEERLVVTLSVFAGYNTLEIGNTIHKKAGSVRSIKSRAFSKLRNEIKL